MFVPEMSEAKHNIHKVICLFSGLGADYRAFQFLKFPEEYELFHVPWPVAVKGERIASFTKRLSANIPKADKLIFIGVSFGGMIAQEMAQYFKVQKVIIISSVPGNKAIPRRFKLPGMRQFVKLLPDKFLKATNPGMNKVFGIKSEKEQRLLAEILADSDPAFVRWAMGQIPKWQANEFPLELVHIHGSADLVFPLNKHLKPDYIIDGGGHFMIANRAGEISEILREVL